MSYSTDSQLLKELSNSELAVLTGDSTGSTVDQNKIDQARFHADTLIDTFLYGRYGVPFEEPPAIINKLSIDLTIVSLYENTYKDAALPYVIVYRKLDAMKLLDKIQNGILKLEGFSFNKTIKIQNNNDKFFDQTNFEIIR